MNSKVSWTIAALALSFSCTLAKGQSWTTLTDPLANNGTPMRLEYQEAAWWEISFLLVRGLGVFYTMVRRTQRCLSRRSPLAERL